MTSVKPAIQEDALLQPLVPRQLVSILDMNRFHADKFMLVTDFLAKMEAIAQARPQNKDDLITEDVKLIFTENVEHASEACAQVGLIHCLQHLKRIKLALSYVDIKFAEYTVLVKELQNRFQDELQSRLLMHIASEKARYYETVELFGQAVADKFPSAAFDIEEAGKCFALDRHTACVMHLMRVIEIGLRAVAKGLNIPDAELLPTWNAIIAKIESAMRTAANKRGSEWLEIEPFYREIPAYLFAIKIAWRNPGMHVEASYDEERAEDIYNAVRGFMRYLATELSE